jgi:hypothetical protein
LSNSVETARRRLKALEGEYTMIHRELVDAVEEAGTWSDGDDAIALLHKSIT